MSVEQNNTADSRQNDNKSRQPSDACQGKELGGPKGPEPTRYGDWEKKGRCIDF
ncbi:MAG: DUF1674 domain-containing protein [Methylococcaceae bacterium]|nr:DUF1674 domain-containing protein [Methylococcaceae bacterium]MCI0668518.1 DUF1674 domain-containing protein [Methylococcaceae bacterium]MCI0733541.1 DUF1674 domain-containing protein [Methylococcaceae bacterium]